MADCSLDYAKLMRKRDKAVGADGKPIPIDLQTLRASTASARGSAENGAEHQMHAAAPPPPPQQHSQPPPQHHSNVVATQYDPQQQMHAHAQPAHGSPYQLMPVSAQPPSAPTHHQLMHPSTQNHEQPTTTAIPAPPWQTAPGRGYPSDQSYLRQPHTRSPPH